MMIMLKKFLRKVVNTLKKYEFYLENLDCANCANKIQYKLINFSFSPPTNLVATIALKDDSNLNVKL